MLLSRISLLASWTSRSISFHDSLVVMVYVRSTRCLTLCLYVGPKKAAIGNRQYLELFHQFPDKNRMVQSEECEEDEELEENMSEEKQHREQYSTNLLSTLEGFKTDGSRSTFAVGGAVSYSDGATVS